MAGPVRAPGKGMSLGRKVGALMAAMVLLSVAGLVVAQYQALRATAIASGVAAQQSTAALLADQVAGGVRWSKFDIVQGVVDRLTAQPEGRIAHIHIADRAGETLLVWPEGVVQAEVVAALGAAQPGASPVVQVTDAHVLVSAPIGDLADLVVAWDLDAVTDAAAAQGAMTLVAGLLAALVIIGVTWWYLNGTLLRPIGAMTDAMGKLAAGDRAIDLTAAAREDEIGAMARAVERFRAAAIEKDELERDAEQARASGDAERRAAEADRMAAARKQGEAVDQLGQALAKLAEGDLTWRIGDGFPDDYAKLRADLNAAFAALQDALGSITANAEAVRGAATRISSASDDLSQRTESQAASLEESAAAIEEIAATTRKTADGAAHARAVVERAKGEAEAGGAVVRDAVAAMSEIESSSEKIGQIIGVIDEIAFQTNLLALNAGVEAARAGEAGRGFAVVASEVRALAQRSADAAKQIKGLILSSKTQVERGVELVGGAGAALERIITGVAEINEAVVEIATSAADQATGLQEVSGAVGQMDQITQQNAAMVEQVTASVRALSRQTDAFAELVARFRTGARSAAPASTAAPVSARPSATVAPLRPAPGKPAFGRAEANKLLPARPAPSKPAFGKSASAMAPAPKPVVALKPATPKPPAPQPERTPPRAAAPAPAPRKVAAGGDAGWEEF